MLNYLERKYFEYTARKSMQLILPQLHAINTIVHLYYIQELFRIQERIMMISFGKPSQPTFPKNENLTLETSTWLQSHN